MEVRTHRLARQSLVGTPIRVVDDLEAEAELRAVEEMAVDELGLVHGGFTFGLADYAAMLAVNHPFVVLAASQVRFTAPVRVGELMRARARVISREGRRREVEVEVSVDGRRVLVGSMTCLILDRHVLER
jgi:acyl-coenzyme A thioesterase PaaI-like protein